MARILNNKVIWITLLFLSSLPVKLATARDMPFDIDYVPVLARGLDWLNGGAFPAYGTLSSVSAYNMPMLVWLHLPALILTRDAFLSILLTMLVINLLTTCAIFGAGTRIFTPRTGFIAAALFTFSEIGISSSYTAWAQLLLPGFFAWTLWLIWEWYVQGRGLFLALAGVVAVAGVMTHFAAILLLPAMLIFAVITRASWQWRWLVAGIVGCLILLSPYLAFQTTRDFVDLRAFITQDSPISADVIAQYDYLKPGSGSLPSLSTEAQPGVVVTEAATSNTSPSPELPTNTAPEAPPRWQRAITFLLSVPTQYFEAIALGFSYGAPALDTQIPILGTLLVGLNSLLHLIFWLTLVGCLLAIRTERQFRRAYPNRVHPPLLGSHRASHTWLIMLLMLTVISGFIFTRNIDQPTYFIGLQSWQWLIVGYGLSALPRLRPVTSALIGFVILLASLNTAERLTRLSRHDDSQHSLFNVSIYRHIAATTDAIADDWQGDDTITIQYDILPEIRNLWWVIPWHTVDPEYRMGWNFDFLLALHHDLHNTVTNPIGTAENPDYVIVYEPGLLRWDLSAYEQWQFGTIYLLKPQEHAR